MIQKAFLAATAVSTGLRSSMEDRACGVDDMKPVLAKAKVWNRSILRRVLKERRRLKKIVVAKKIP